jgi:hypothetical protein
MSRAQRVSSAECAPDACGPANLWSFTDDHPLRLHPPKVWTWDKESGGRFANINRPIAGPTHEKELPVGRHPLQLYSLGTPNGVKVTVMLEELLRRAIRAPNTTPG